MIAALMVYGVIAGTLLALGGMAIELSAGVSRRFPRRFIWCSTMVLAVALIALAALRSTGPRVELPSADPQPAALQAPIAGVVEISPSGPVAVVNLIRETLFEKPALVAGQLAIDGRWLLGFWMIGSALLLAVGCASAIRYRRLRSGWPGADVEGRRVRVSPAVGPAVIGLLRPEVVVPRWLLEASAEERRLAIAHEGEHLRARDGVLLAAGWVIVAAFPWNPALWWMLFRLRLAIEIDCDQRVLANGAGRHQYGSMLIDLSAHGSGLSLTVPALAGFPSTLERRLVAMTTDSSSRPRVLRVFGGMFGAVAVLTACGSELPSAAQIEGLDAAQVESQARVLGIDSTAFFVDGVQVAPEEARALDPTQIASVEVRRVTGTDGSNGSIHIQTQPAAPVASGVQIEEVRVVGYGADGQAPSGVVIFSDTSGAPIGEVVVQGYGARSGAAPAGDTYQFSVGAVRPSADSATVVQGLLINDGSGSASPLFVIDGVTATEADFNRIIPARIEGITVLKDGSATAQYTDPRARNGVVLITTKSGTP